jgi:hypothetical protein
MLKNIIKSVIITTLIQKISFKNLAYKGNDASVVDDKLQDVSMCIIVLLLIGLTELKFLIKNITQSWKNMKYSSVCIMITLISILLYWTVSCIPTQFNDSVFIFSMTYDILFPRIALISSICAIVGNFVYYYFISVRNIYYPLAIKHDDNILRNLHTHVTVHFSLLLYLVSGWRSSLKIASLSLVAIYTMNVLQLLYQYKLVSESGEFNSNILDTSGVHTEANLMCKIFNILQNQFIQYFMGKNKSERSPNYLVNKINYTIVVTIYVFQMGRFMYFATDHRYAFSTLQVSSIQCTYIVQSNN